MADAESEQTRIRRFLGSAYSSSILKTHTHKDIVFQPFDRPGLSNDKDLPPSIYLDSLTRKFLIPSRG